MVKNKPHIAAVVREGEEFKRPNLSLPVRILTHNIRYAATDLDDNERPWRERCPRIVNELRYHTRFLDGATWDPKAESSCPGSGASFICLQECLHDQLRDILKGLNGIEDNALEEKLPDGPLWTHIGVARDDGKTQGEYNPILYPRKVFKLLHLETAWLSPTPSRPSIGWDAACVRILTTGVFEHRGTRQRLAVFNTHLDHASSEARRKSVPVILDVMGRVRLDWAANEKRGLCFALAGDFNSSPSQEAYEAMVASGCVVDTFDAVPRTARYGDVDTFTGFTPPNDEGELTARIDFVWLGPKSRVYVTDSENEKGRERHGWKVEGYSTLSNVFDDGVFCSDHRAVVSDAVLLGQ